MLSVKAAESLLCMAGPPFHAVLTRNPRKYIKLDMKCLFKARIP